jgi:hypothetical protein
MTDISNHMYYFDGHLKRNKNSLVSTASSFTDSYALCNDHALLHFKIMQLYITQDGR